MMSALGLLGLIGAASAQSLGVKSGWGCEIDSNGCVTDGFGNYSNNERCTIEILETGTLTSSFFSTEQNRDGWTVYPINGNSSNLYSGVDSPNNVKVSSGDYMTWSSGPAVSYAGYTICLVGGRVHQMAQPEVQTAASRRVRSHFGITTTLSATSDYFFDPSTLSGGCELDSAGCWTDGVGSYANNMYCSICTARGGYVSRDGNFETEAGYDYITIDGTRYDGYDGPSFVYLYGSQCISWRSDGSYTRDGWRLCEDGFGGTTGFGFTTTTASAVGQSSSDDDDDASFPWWILGCLPIVFVVGCIVFASAQTQKQARDRAQQQRPPAYQNGAFVAPKPVVTPWAAPAAPRAVTSFGVPTVAASASPYANVAATGGATTMTTYKAATTIQAGYRGFAVRKKLSQPRRSSAFGKSKPTRFDVPDVKVDTGDPFADLTDPFAAAMSDMDTVEDFSGRNVGGYPNSRLIPRSSDAVVPAYRPPPKPWLTAPY